MPENNALLSLNLNYWFLQTAAMVLTALLLPRLKITSVFGALGTVLALAFINSKVWDAALFFSVPDSFSTHAVLLLLTNGIIFWVLVKLLPGIEIEGFLPAIVAPLVFTACSLLIAKYGPLIDWLKLLDLIIDLLQQLRTYFQSTAPEAVPTEQTEARIAALVYLI